MLTPKQLAERTGISPNLVYTWCERGLLPHVRLGAPGKRGKILIAEEDWAAFLAARRVGECGPALSVPPPKATTRFRHLKLS
jgi:excisionase family DNA binding protein